MCAHRLLRKPHLIRYAAGLVCFAAAASFATTHVPASHNSSLIYASYVIMKADPDVCTSAVVIEQHSEAAGDQAAATTPGASAPLFSLWRYATPRERALAIVGAIIACFSGASLPAFSLIFGGT